MKKSVPLILLLACCFISCKTDKTTPLQIATAANMQFAMTEVIETFKNEYNIECNLIVSSSGKLTAQIIEGAPYDLFISADMKYPNTLFKKGCTTSKPTIYAFGNLVMWTINSNNKPSLENLTSENVKHVAIANPKTAPYGKAAVELLQHLKIYDTIKKKLVYGESIAQTNQFIITGAAEVGFTAKAVVLSPHLKGKGVFTELDNNMYSPIKQGVVILKNGRAEANYQKKFYNFLLSKKGSEILNKFGYTTVN